ncbi:MAG: acyl-CoA dehydrogenase [Pseudomonadales bacterium]|nr:acyl-CoA dehydrogenase [Pseudomonadales bacterium]
MADTAAFREEVRGWLEENCPESMRTPMPADETPGGGRRAQFKNPDTKLWMDRCAEKGYTVPSWPTEYGGAGLDKNQVVVFQEEMRRVNARPPHVGMGISMIGPALLEYGTDEQKAEHLPKIASGEIWWCQGYSEPGSGSDLASLRTAAVDDGDDFLVTGQKIWTSGANFADWMFCLVRTDPDAPKHEGISFVLFDMETPGVSVKPILLISGMSPFCETFLDQVRVAKSNLVYELNKGWTVGKRLLQYERSSIGGIGGGQKARSLEEFAKEYVGEDDTGKIADTALRTSIISHRVNDRAFSLTMRRSMEESETGRAPGALSSFFKLYGTEQNKNKYELLANAMGTQFLGWEGDTFSEEEKTQTRAWLRSKANSIEGGTTEVQLNIIAKRILSLPD